jgi:hypothetical protein
MIAPDETLIEGNFVVALPILKPDAAEQRIETLLSRWLVHLADDPVSGAWQRLYKDPSDGRLWELTYPRSQMHGGGPRRLRVITPDEAASVYGWKHEV